MTHYFLIEWNAQKEGHDEDIALLSPRLVEDGKATPIFKAVCTDKGGNLKKFTNAWKAAVSYAATFEKFTGEAFNLVEAEEAQMLNAFDRVNTEELCNLGHKQFGIHGRRNLEDAVFWGDVMKRHIPTKRKDVTDLPYFLQIL